MLRKKNYQLLEVTTVSGDGTWKTPGHSSRIGVCSVIEDVTGKVIDVAVLSSYCKGCENGEPPCAEISVDIRRGMDSDFEYLLVEENSTLFVCAAKVRLLKLQDEDHERGADQPNPTRA
ncbi:hypothetical protein TNCV_3079761 [Trichonephila clavipes]|nr:hypothetical protein TNCV_3079761 [Trichonephila clavipes]